MCSRCRNCGKYRLAESRVPRPGGRCGSEGGNAVECVPIVRVDVARNFSVAPVPRQLDCCGQQKVTEGRTFRLPGRGPDDVWDGGKGGRVDVALMA